MTGPLYVKDEETGRWAAFIRTRDANHNGVVFGPKPPGHASLGKHCPACDVPFQEGDLTVLVALGPGDDPEYQEKARYGSWYNAIAVEVFICKAMSAPFQMVATVSKLTVSVIIAMPRPEPACLRLVDVLPEANDWRNGWASDGSV